MELEEVMRPIATTKFAPKYSCVQKKDIRIGGSSRWDRGGGHVIVLVNEVHRLKMKLRR